VLVGLSPCEEEPPTLSVSLSPSTLFPTNHKYVDSNEPYDALGGADGTTRNDTVVVDDDTFRLRAERVETGSGRIYTITYRATDECGNVATRGATVRVPVRSQGR
jgi:uncharacterized protein